MGRFPAKMASQHANQNKIVASPDLSSEFALGTGTHWVQGIVGYKVVSDCGFGNWSVGTGLLGVLHTYTIHM